MTRAGASAGSDGYSTLSLCSSGGAFEAVPRPRRSVDLAMVKAGFEQAGVEVVDARVMLIVRTTPEATISRDGRIVLKTRDRGSAERLFKEILGMMETPGLPPRRAAP